jgi:Zn-finger nucleic acid-binding protein/ribosomal protein L40E
MIVACDRCGRQYDLSKYTPGQKARCLCANVLVVPKPKVHDAEMLHCANCGAPLRQDAERCDYCGGGVDRDRARFTLVCPRCFARLPKHAKYCIGCGGAIRPQAISTETESKLPCPRCVVTLHCRRLEEIDFYECPQCCGLWLENEAFRQISRLKVKEYESNPLPEKSAAVQKLDPVVYLRCPVCRNLMNRTNFGRRSGVIIDRCTDHGLWLDEAELERIARFIAQGGLARARKHEAAAAKRRTRQSFQARRSARVSARSLNAIDDDWSAESGVGAGFLGFLAGLFFE